MNGSLCGKGFTLIELLVSISIIMVLIAILLPSLRNARETARDVACLSNLKQMGIATTAYSVDNREVAMYMMDSWGTSSTTGWFVRLARNDYMNTQGYRCPSEETNFNADSLMSGVNATSNPQRANISYGLNFYTFGYLGDTPCAPVHLESVLNKGRPNETIYFADSTPQAKMAASQGYLVEWNSATFPRVPTGLANPVSMRHSQFKKGNALFADAHAGGLIEEEMVNKKYWSPRMRNLFPSYSPQLFRAGEW